jgi:hypothetical protein
MPVLEKQGSILGRIDTMIRKKEDRDTRYFIDPDLKTGKIPGRDYDRRERPVSQD